MGHKIERLQQVIKFKVSSLIQRDLQDPRIGIITVTYVKLARDLSTCTIGYSVLGTDSDCSKSEHAIEDARGWLQREVAGALRTRKAPQLTFKYDESIAGSARIAALLRDELGEEGETAGEDSEADSTDDATDEATKNELDDDEKA